MNGFTLKPRRAALFAQQAYQLKNPETFSQFLRRYKDDFDIEENETDQSLDLNGQALRGTTGSLLFIKSSHVMGICTFGKGQYARQAFVFLKGTASGFDVLTDLNAGVRQSETGSYVHQGFEDTFQSFHPQLKKFLEAINKRTDLEAIHCVGHSLGGALATLCADWLKANTRLSVKLYTFGSPRVGLPNFAKNITERITSENVFRVHHTYDPIAMVPTWPFTHVPDSGTDYLLSCGHINHHKMDHYVSSVSGDGKTSLEWKTLKVKRPTDYLDHSIEQWLKSDGPVSLCLNSARVIDAALIWVLKKIFQAGAIIAIGGGATTFTLLDRLAYYLHKAYDFSKDLGYWVMRLIARMAKAIGITVTEKTHLTVSFIRMIFTRMHHHVSELVRKATQDF